MWSYVNHTTPNKSHTIRIVFSCKQEKCFNKKKKKSSIGTLCFSFSDSMSSLCCTYRKINKDEMNIECDVIFSLSYVVSPVYFSSVRIFSIPYGKRERKRKKINLNELIWWHLFNDVSTLVLIYIYVIGYINSASSAGNFWNVKRRQRTGCECAHKKKGKKTVSELNSIFGKRIFTVICIDIEICSCPWLFVSSNTFHCHWVIQFLELRLAV